MPQSFWGASVRFLLLLAAMIASPGTSAQTCDVFADAGFDQAVCGTQTLLNASLQSDESGQWSLVSGPGGTVSSPSSPNSIFSGVAGVTYVLEWQVTTGPSCVDTDTVEVTFYDGPVADAGGDQQLCNIDNTTLSANAASGLDETGTWSEVAGDGAVIFGDVNSPVSTLTGTLGQDYTLRWSVSNGVCPAASDDVQVDLISLSANAGPEQFVCGDSTTLNASGSGSWSIQSGGGATVAQPANPESAFSGNRGQSYALEWQATEASCTDTDTTTINLLNATTQASAGPDVQVCGSSTTNLDAVAPTGFLESGTWSIVSGDGNGSFADPGAADTQFTGIPGQTYVARWTVDNGGCEPTSDDVVIELTDVVAEAGADQAVCGATTTLQGSGSGEWTILSGTGGSLVDSSSAVTGFNGVRGEAYSLQWQETDGACSDTDTTNVVLYDDPTASAGADIQACAASVALGAADPTGLDESGAWSEIDGDGNGTFVDAGNPDTQFSGGFETPYTLVWEVSNGVCPAAQDSIQVELFQAPELIASKAVQPRQARVGETVTYQVVVENAGQCPLPDNPGPEFVDSMPQPLTVSSASADLGTVVVEDQEVAWNGAVTPGEQVTITIDAVVDGAFNGSIANQATVFFDSNNDGTNDASLVTDDPNTGDAGDATGLSILAPVPALSFGGLLLLAVLLAGLAIRRGSGTG